MQVSARFCLALVLALLLPSMLHAAVPNFRTAAAARDWGEARQRAGDFPDAAAAFEQEARIRRVTGDPQGADVETRRARRLETDLAVAVPGPVPAPGRLAKWEPAAGCYLGVQDGDGASADDFQEAVGRHLALVYQYSRYGDPFPADWVAEQRARGRAVQIAWEPNDIRAVRDDDYLEEWATEAGQSGVPIFLRFGGEMNGAWTPWGRDPALYRRAFRTVHDVCARLAPNVAMVWAPNAVPTENLDEYFPGDDVVDWVGISLYVVRFYDDRLSSPAWQDHPLNLIAPIYAKYAVRHPICLAEWGVSRRSHVEGTDQDGFAASRIEDLFAAIKVRFPHLKMVCAYDRNNLSGEYVAEGRRLNDYALPSGSAAFDAYQTAASDPYFLSSVSQGGGAVYAYHRLTDSLPEGYHGFVAVSLSSYLLNPALEIARAGLLLRRARPYSFVLPPGSGPLTLRVRDAQGRAAETVVLRESASRLAGCARTRKGT